MNGNISLISENTVHRLLNVFRGLLLFLSVCFLAIILAWQIFPEKISKAGNKVANHYTRTHDKLYKYSVKHVDQNPAEAAEYLGYLLWWIGDVDRQHRLAPLRRKILKHYYNLHAGPLQSDVEFRTGILEAWHAFDPYDLEADARLASLRVLSDQAAEENWQKLATLFTDYPTGAHVAEVYFESLATAGRWSVAANVVEKYQAVSLRENWIYWVGHKLYPVPRATNDGDFLLEYKVKQMRETPEQILLSLPVNFPFRLVKPSIWLAKEDYLLAPEKRMIRRIANLLGADIFLSQLVRDGAGLVQSKPGKAYLTAKTPNFTLMPGFLLYVRMGLEPALPVWALELAKPDSLSQLPPDQKTRIVAMIWKLP